jgi:hypothetical protein
MVAMAKLFLFVCISTAQDFLTFLETHMLPWLMCIQYKFGCKRRLLIKIPKILENFREPRKVILLSYACASYLTSYISSNYFENNFGCILVVPQ